MNKKLIKNNLFIIPKIFKKSIPFYIPITIGIIYRLNTIALFLIPLQAISSISKGTLAPKFRNLFEILRLPIPKDDNLFLFFFILIISILLNLIVIDIIKQNLVLNIKNQVFINNERKLSEDEIFETINNKFLKVDNYIKTTENIVLCGILILLIILLDPQIAFITLIGGTFYYVVSKRQVPKPGEEDLYDFQYLYYLNKPSLRKLPPIHQRVLTETLKKSSFWKAVVSTSIMLLILLSIYKRADTAVSIIFIFLVRIYINQMLKGIKDFIELNNKSNINIDNSTKSELDK